MFFLQIFKFSIPIKIVWKKSAFAVIKSLYQSFMCLKIDKINIFQKTVSLDSLPIS